jgi:hypothetical protein
LLRKVEDKYPKLSEIYKEIDASFQHYSDSTRLLKVKRLYKKIEEVFEKWKVEHKDCDIFKGMENGDEYYVHFLDHIQDLLTLLVSESCILKNIHFKGDYNQLVWDYITSNNLPDRAFEAYLEDAKS